MMSGNNTLAFFLGIKKTYDNVTSGNMARRLGELEAAGRGQAFAEDFLRDRRIRVRLGKCLSEKRTL